MIRKIILITICFLICYIQCNENEEEKDVFVPTKEWQVVKKGQKIPKGLHVRVNFESGVTEAKLLEEEEKSKALSSLPQSDQTHPKSELENALKNIKSESTIDPDQIKKIKDKFRSYQEIKQNLDELNLSPKTDAEIIIELIAKHKAVLNEQHFKITDLLGIIEDLDYLAHQYDNAREFINQNGLHKIIYININSSHVEVRKETLKLMASLFQNNLVPKIRGVETGAVGILLRLINFDSDAMVKNRALTALSALIRSFPFAQKKFIENGGFTVLAKLFDTDDLKIQTKAITMISDLIIEFNLGIIDSKLKAQYNSLNLIKYVLEHNWCENLNKFLFRLLITDRDDHDSIEKCLTAMHALRSQCGAKFEKNILIGLQQRYAGLSTSEEGDEGADPHFFKNLKGLCDEILHYVSDNFTIKTEL